MALKEYGVWTAKAVRVTAQPASEDSKSPHIHLFYDDGTGGEYDSARRASINVKSGSAISELVVYIDLNFQHPITKNLAELQPGFLKLENKPNGLALDYIRGNLVDPKTGRILPHDIPGKENDVLDLVKPLLDAAVARGATVHLFGEPYLPSRQGIHDVHMNQGSTGGFAKFNGVWQDGGMFIQNSDGTYTAILIAFASQAAHTDERTGDALPGSCNLKQLILGEACGGDEHDDDDKDKIQGEMNVALVGALVNPIGPEGTPAHTGRPETLWLMNRSPKPVNLKGWSILNKAEQVRLIAEDVTLPPGGIHAVEMGNVPLSNKGGLLTLLDDKGIKIDGVSYTKQQAQKEGYVVIFR